MTEEEEEEEEAPAPPAEGSESSGSPAPEPKTIGEALRLSITPTVGGMLRRAVAEAGQDNVRVVGLRHLIRAAANLGIVERGEADTPNRFAAAFATALEQAVGPQKLAEQVGALPFLSMPDPPLSPLAQAVIAQARFLSRVATNEDFIAARHLIVSLTAPLAPGLRAAVGRVWRTQWGIDPAVLHPALRAAMATELQPNEDARAWLSLGGGVRVAPGFAADAAVPARIDPLGFAADAQRLAELACLRANAPPMAVGLFGDWGSGKSTFMARMQEAVSVIKADSAALLGRDGRPVFDSHIVQIRFNAWTYADADLWAGIATEIFDQLRIALTPEEQRGRATLPEPLRQLMDRIGLSAASAHAVETAQQNTIAELKATLESDRARLEELSRATPPDPVQQAQAAMRGEATALLAADPALPRRLALATGMVTDDQLRQVDALVAEARSMTASARGVSVRARTALALLGTRHALPLLLAALVLLAAPALLPYLLPPDWKNALVSNLGVALTGALGVAGFLRKVGQESGPLLNALSQLDPTIQRLSDARQRQLEAERARAGTIAALQAGIAEAEARLTQMVARQAVVAADAQRLSDIAAGRQPAALLRAFLEESTELRAIGDRLGLVSRLHRVFRSLAHLMAQARLAREKAEAEGGAVDATLPRIDRIILYIDDLDRCRPEQVVQVLEALALLLQFDLFVAVVAVDDGWLKAALRIHYREVIEKGGLGGPEQFLEKIFQIPFWLRSMRDTDVNRYGAFVAHLAPEAVAPGAAPGAMAIGGPVPGTAPNADMIDPDELPQPGDASPFAQENRGDTVERVSLTEPELNVLSALAPLAGGTPRAVKRFVNLYRLVRSSRQGAALEAFLGQRGEVPEFLAMAFALACESGLSAAQGRTLRNLAVAMGSGLMTDLTRQNPASGWQLYAPTSLQMPSPIAALDEPAGENIAEAIAAVERILPAALRAEMLNPIWHEAARFSFNRPP